MGIDRLLLVVHGADLAKEKPPTARKGVEITAVVQKEVGRW